MTVSRREGLVRLARKYNALVICDDVYDFLQWPVVSPPRPGSSSPSAAPPPPEPLPRLVDIDLALGPGPDDPHHFGHAISNGSFSKIVSPGMRTGWVEASPAFAFGLAQTGSTKSGGAPSREYLEGAAICWLCLKASSLTRSLHIQKSRQQSSVS
jgi:DNA-binding transcriptional MocR family regulator